MAVPTGWSVIRSEPVSVSGALGALSHVLLDEADTLTDRLATAIVEREPVYGGYGDATCQALWRHLRATVELWVQSLAAGQLFSEELEAAARDTGRLRARQGLPLEAVLRAYRLVGRTLWEALLTASREHFQGRYDHVLLDVASDVWRLIDHSSSVLADAYRGEEARLSRQEPSHKQAVLTAILEGRDQDPALIKEAADVLGLPENGRLVCVVAIADSPGDEPLHAPKDVLAAQGLASAWSRGPAEVVGMISLGRKTLDTVLKVLRPAVVGRAGVSPVVDGLAHAGSGYDLAKIAVQTLREPCLATLDDQLPEALLISSPGLASRVLPAAFGSALNLPGQDRKTLLDTLEALLVCHGSATHAAQRLHCHRNTVLYRLQRIEETTGRSLSEPRDRLLLTLGILARRTDTASSRC